MRSLISFLTLSLSIAFYANAFGANFAAGLTAYQKGDFATAAKEWRPLAEQGDREAQFNLGLLYIDGQGVPQDPAAGAAWFQKSADQDFTKAQLNLGALYGSGRGVKRDYVQAYKWLSICAAKGDRRCTAQRDLVVKKLKPAQLNEAQHLASSWKPATQAGK